jgi:hypothetical protein
MICCKSSQTKGLDDSADVIQQRIWKNKERLIRNSMTICIAAAITHANISIIKVILDDPKNKSMSILYHLVYALFFAHLFGIIMTLYLPIRTYLFPFFLRLSTEIPAMAWKETIIIILIDGFIEPYGILSAAFSWIGILILLVLLLVSAKYVVTRFLNASSHRKDLLLEYDAEVFTLSLAFSFTALLSYLIYLPYMDDALKEILTGESEESDKEEEIPENKYVHAEKWIYLFYCIVITYISGFLYSLLTSSEDELSRPYVLKVGQIRLVQIVGWDLKTTRFFPEKTDNVEGSALPAETGTIVDLSDSDEEDGEETEEETGGESDPNGGAVSVELTPSTGVDKFVEEKEKKTRSVFPSETHNPLATRLVPPSSPSQDILASEGKVTSLSSRLRSRLHELSSTHLPWDEDKALVTVLFSLVEGMQG